MKQNSITSRIVKNVNRVLEVVPRTLNKDAEVIKLDFKKPRSRRKLKTSARKSRKSAVKPSRSVSMKPRGSKRAMPATTRAKRAVKSTSRSTKRGVSARKGRMMHSLAGKRKASGNFSRAA